MAEINPLAVLQSLSPKLSGAPNEGVQKLGLQALSNKGGLDRQALANIGSRNTTALALGVDVDSPTFSGDLSSVLDSQNFGRNAGATRDLASAGTFSLPTPDQTLAGSSSPNALSFRGEPIGVSAAKAAAGLKFGEKKESGITGARFNEKTGILENTTEKTTTFIEGKRSDEKALAEAIALQREVEKRFPGRKATVVRDPQTGEVQFFFNDEPNNRQRVKKK